MGNHDLKNIHQGYIDRFEYVAMQIYALEMAVRGYYPVVRGQIALTLPMTDENITGFIETSKELITEIYK